MKIGNPSTFASAAPPATSSNGATVISSPTCIEAEDDIHLVRHRLAVRGVCAAETLKPYFTQARTSTNFDPRPDSTRARTPECPRSRRPRSLRRAFLEAPRSAGVSPAAIEASRLG